MKVKFSRYGLIALTMAFTMTLCYSCSRNDEETSEDVNTPSEEEKEEESVISGYMDGHAYVELAGVKWAMVNVGALNYLEHFTDYQYNSGYGYYTQPYALKAAESWGKNWTLPTGYQCQTLLDSCNWTWKDKYPYNGMNIRGYIVSDKKDSSKFIFLPAAGYAPNEDKIFSFNMHGHYWTSGEGRALEFGLYEPGMREESPYFYGYPVRPVVVDSSDVNLPSSVDGQINGYPYVELAGIKWATENVGAEYGTETRYASSRYGYYYEAKKALNAAKSWGGTWTLPTDKQWQKLVDECDWTWKEEYSYKGRTKNDPYGGKELDGYIVSDKKDPSRFIFLPAAGYIGPIISSSGGNGYYWSMYDHISSSQYWPYLWFCKTEAEVTRTTGFSFQGYYDYETGYSVRPVSE